MLSSASVPDRVSGFNLFFFIKKKKNTPVFDMTAH